MSYVDQIEQALGIATEGKTRIVIDTFSFERQIGVSAWWPDGFRRAALTDFADGWPERIIAKLTEARNG